MKSTTTALLVSLSLLGLSLAYPSGAPTGVCETMQPSVYTHGFNSQTGVPPYWLSVSRTSISPGDQVQVIVNGSQDFRGILLQARDPETNSIVGNFDVEETGDFKTLPCADGYPNSAVTHANRDDKPPRLTFTWMSPNDMDFKRIMFVATFVKTKVVYYLNVTSSIIDVGAPVTSAPARTCSVSDTWKAASCAGNLQSRITDNTKRLHDGQMDVKTFCNELEDNHDTFFLCSITLIADCASVMNHTIELYRNTSSTYCNCDVPFNCFADPCMVPPPNCPEAEVAQCLPYYCGGCWAVWVDRDEKVIQCSNQTSPATTTATTTATTEVTTIPVVYPPSGAGTLVFQYEILVGSTLLWLLLSFYL